MTETHQWDPDELAASWVSPPGLGRCIGIGSGIGIVLSFVGIALPSLLSGMEWQSAVGFGAFVAFWGGLGFGSMMGGVAYVMALEKSAPAEALARTKTDAGPGSQHHLESSSTEGSGDRRVA